MTQQEFINVLKENRISFEKKDDKVIIVHKEDINLNSLETLPAGIWFNNRGNLYLNALLSMPEGVQFNNPGLVSFSALQSMPEGVQFNNGWYVHFSYLTTLPKGVRFNNGGDVFLRSILFLSEEVQFNNGGDVYLKNEQIKDRSQSYCERCKVEKQDNGVILYKRVSKNYKTQEYTHRETAWLPGSEIEHPLWNPYEEECGGGKFHACARPSWCDMFRNVEDDRYIAVLVEEEDLYEWKSYPDYPQKIAFRKGKVLYEVDREGRKIKSILP